MNRKTFALNRLSYAVSLALASGAMSGVAHAGAGWGDSARYDGAPVKTPTYYANSPSGALPANACFDTAPPATGAYQGAMEAAQPGAGAACSSGAALRKFVDTLPSLAAATPDKAAYPGADYFEIAVVEYTQRMHSDLPKATTLRGYVQIVKSGGIQLNTIPGVRTSADDSVRVAAAPSYLGPVIVATSGVPTRIKFMNLLPVGSAGDLRIPVDETLAGAGLGPDGVTKYQQNRAELHLHGGDNPWISDGTPHQWILPAADELALKAAGKPEMARGAGAVNVPDMPNPGPGAMTYYWPNGTSGRLMFYHDHSIGLTRLNVYAGEAAGYLVTDAPGKGENTPAMQAALPADQIPLVIQDKTFVPENIGMQDAKWNVAKWGQPGDLWFPHVYETNQDPNSIDGTNPVGRWDWGPWFWPVFPSQFDLPQGTDEIVNPAVKPINEVSTTPEGFHDTPLVNGMAYPSLTVEPKAYRFRILNAANDRFVNLGLYLAADKKSVQVDPNGAPLPANQMYAGAMLCDGANPVSVADCTEVKMVNFDASYVPPAAPYTADGSLGFPDGTDPRTAGLNGSGWGTPVGAVFPMGVPDPATAGPAIVQIGNEGGLLAAPAVIPATPINYEYNKRSVTVLNVQERGLYLGAAERADVVIDFSQYAGKTLILYNDSPAPVPASDPRIDYFTGQGDQTGAGGAPNTLPGYGPNTRTVMQIHVKGPGEGAAPAAPYDLAALQSAMAGTAGGYATSQEKPVVPESGFNAAFGTSWTDTLARIYTGAIYLNRYNGLSFTPVEKITYTQAPTCSTAATCQTAAKPKVTYDPATGSAGPITAYVENKAIQELFDPAYGRMNATLGVELPFTSALTQTTIPLGYVDPATETVADGETQFWKITHNGVDTHPVHFHLVNVQVINRVGWDGTLKPPLADEIGWKETVKMNPLEDIVVAVRAKKPTLSGVTGANTFGLPLSRRLMDPSQPVGSTLGFTQVNPATGNPATVANDYANYGWEYVWHCHILGHEENDFMRPVVFNANEAAAAAPTNLTVDANGVLAWTDAATTEYAYKVERAPLVAGVAGAFVDVSAGITPASYGVAPLANANTFTDTTLAAGTDYQYRVTAIGAAGNGSATVNLQAPPVAPSGLAATVNAAGTPATVTLSWADNAGNESSYTVTRDGLLIATLAANATGYVDHAVVDATSYTYTVQAVNAAGSANSNSVSVTTPVGLPTAPTGLTAVANSATQVTLAWTDNATNESSYTVTRGGAVIATLPAGSTGYVDTTVIAGTTYVYSVQAVDAAGSASSPNVSVTTPTAVVLNAPAGVSAQLVTAASVQVSWTDTSTGESAYVIERSRNGGAFVTAATVAANATVASVPLPQPTGLYAFRVKAMDGAVSGPLSSAVTVNLNVVPADIATAPAAASTAPGSVTVNWADVANNNASYSLQTRVRIFGNLFGPWVTVTSAIGANATSYTVSGLASGSVRQFRLRAANARGSANNWSPASAAVTVQ